MDEERLPFPNRRKKKDRREGDRRIDERRRAGIGEVMDDRRRELRRLEDRRSGIDRRESPEEWKRHQQRKQREKTPKD